MPGSDDLNGLPETYALALRLRGEGLGDEAIGRVLDIETESVGTPAQPGRVQARRAGVPLRPRWCSRGPEPALTARSPR